MPRKTAAQKAAAAAKAITSFDANFKTNAATPMQHVAALAKTESTTVSQAKPTASLAVNGIEKNLAAMALTSTPIIFDGSKGGDGHPDFTLEYMRFYAFRFPPGLTKKNWPAFTTGAKVFSVEQIICMYTAMLNEDEHSAQRILALDHTSRKTAKELEFESYGGANDVDDDLSKEEQEFCLTLLKEQILDLEAQYWGPEGPLRNVLFEALNAKFRHVCDKEGHQAVRRLLGTGDRELIYANPNDNILGIGMDANTARGCRNKWEKTGQNGLGKCLMRVRQSLRTDTRFMNLLVSEEKATEKAEYTGGVRW